MRKHLVQGAILTTAAAGLVAALLLRSRESEPPPERRATLPKTIEAPPRMPTPPPVMTPPAPADVVTRAVVDARLKTTYDNYRTAVATGNAGLADVLRPVLLKEKTAALKIARLDLQSSRSPDDRAIAAQVIEALERSR